MQKLYLSLALLMSLVLGTGFAISGNSVSAQSYQMNEKQSYDDSSYSSDSYSKYPTKEKPFVCQKGPFKGFYVSSVEFCKFDDRKDMKHGDDNSGSDFNTYVVTGEESLVPVRSDDPVQAQASCEEGDQRTGGGYTIREIDPGSTNPVANPEVTFDRPFPLTGEALIEGWEVELTVEQPPEDDATNTFGITAYAVCAENSEDDDKNHQYGDDNRQYDNYRP